MTLVCEVYRRTRSLTKSNGMTPLLIGCYIDNTDIVRELVNADACVNAVNNSGQTALHIAARNGNTEIVDMLIKHECRVNAMSRYTGMTALHEASSRGHHKVVEILLDNGAHINTVDFINKNPEYYAANEEVKEIFQKHQNIDQPKYDLVQTEDPPDLKEILEKYKDEESEKKDPNKSKPTNMSEVKVKHKIGEKEEKRSKEPNSNSFQESNSVLSKESEESTVSKTESKMIETKVKTKTVPMENPDKIKAKDSHIDKDIKLKNKETILRSDAGKEICEATSQKEKIIKVDPKPSSQVAKKSTFSNLILPPENYAKRNSTGKYAKGKETVIKTETVSKEKLKTEKRTKSLYQPVNRRKSSSDTDSLSSDSGSQLSVKREIPPKKSPKQKVILKDHTIDFSDKHRERMKMNVFDRLLKK